MAELFETGREGGETALTETIYLQTASMDWRETGHDGWLVKTLFKGPGGTPLTQLMKVEPGATSDLHGHAEVEQVYVLEGSFYDQHRTYRAGDFLMRPAQAQHTAASDEGALLLLIYTAP
jgi:anti-sigma factor ChrR (cupin superfamily)